MLNQTKQIWTPIRQYPKQINSSLKSWLSDPNSMTQKIRDQGVDVTVDILNNVIDLPSPDEQSYFDQTNTHSYLIREVLIFANNHPWIIGRSIIPENLLIGKYQSLKDLGKQPLGDFLFKQPDLTRSEIEIAKINRDDLVENKINIPILQDRLWARRSVFSISAGDLLLTEVFLPSMLIDLGIKDDV